MKLKLLGVAVVSLLLSLFVFVGVTNAQVFKTGDSPTITSSDTVDGSAYMSGSTIDVAGNVNGDLYCAGQNVTISGTIDGDILCAAQTISVTGQVTGDIRIAAQTINMSGTVGKSATLMGQTIRIESQGRIGQDATLTGQDVAVNGQIVRDLVVASAVTTIDTTIGRNVTANTANLRLGSVAVIQGTLNYTSPQELSQASGAAVVGEVNYTQATQQKPENVYAYNAIGALVWVLMLLVSALIFALLFPQTLRDVTNKSVTSPLYVLINMAVGFVAGIVIPFAVFFLIITVLGIPFAFVVVLAWLLILALSGVFAAYYVGRIVWRRQTNVVLSMVVGTGILVLLSVIPILNILVVFLSVVYGTGAQLMRLKDTFVKPQYDV